MTQLREKAIIRNVEECKKGKEKGLERDCLAASHYYFFRIHYCERCTIGQLR